MSEEDNYDDTFDGENPETPAAVASSISSSRNDKAIELSSNQDWERWRVEAEMNWREELRVKEHCLRQNLALEVRPEKTYR